MNIKIVYENENLLVVDKPAGLVVHPASRATLGYRTSPGTGECEPTLVDFLLQKYPKMKKYPWPDPERPGIVHRLDKDTSGLLIVAKNPQTQKALQQKFQNHEIQKTYLALVLGPVQPEKGKIVTKISRSHRDFRLKKTSIFSLDESAKTAISHYQIIKTLHLKPYTLNLLEIQIITGRTHQIRTQMKYQGWPIIGDQQYNTKISRRISDELNLHRQFLHAQKLGFVYNGRKMEFQSKLPEDLVLILPKIR